MRPVLEASYSTVQYTGGLGTAMIPKVSFFCNKNIDISCIPESFHTVISQQIFVKGVLHFVDHDNFSTLE